MPDFPSVPLLGGLHTQGIGGFGPCGVSSGLNAIPSASTAWPAANRAIFVPVRIPVPVTVYYLSTGGGTGTTGNFDLGIYDAFGNKIVSLGSTAKAVASSELLGDITDTFLGPGLYYLAMAADSTDAYQAVAPGNIGIAKMFGVREMETAFPLPATATFATIQASYVPPIVAHLRSDA